MNFYLTLLLLLVVAFFQNMTFTWSSRSRNSGDYRYHFFVAILSNAVWFVCNFVIVLPSVMSVIHEKGIFDWKNLLIGLVYTLSTSAGSAYMMKLLIKKERGKRKVGA